MRGFFGFGVVLLSIDGGGGGASFSLFFFFSFFLLQSKETKARSSVLKNSILMTSRSKNAHFVIISAINNIVIDYSWEFCFLLCLKNRICKDFASCSVLVLLGSPFDWDFLRMVREILRTNSKAREERRRVGWHERKHHQSIHQKPKIGTVVPISEWIKIQCPMHYNRLFLSQFIGIYCTVESWSQIPKFSPLILLSYPHFHFPPPPSFPFCDVSNPSILSSSSYPLSTGITRLDTHRFWQFKNG